MNVLRQRPRNRVNQFVELVLNCLHLRLSRRIGDGLSQHIDRRVDGSSINRRVERIRRGVRVEIHQRFQARELVSQLG